MRPPSLMSVPPDLLDGSRGRKGAYVLGVDGGATKTTAAVFEVAGARLWTGRAGPTNADAVGAAAAAEAAGQAVEQALEAAQAAAADVGASVVAVAGTIPAELDETLQTRFGLERVYVVNDVVAAWAAGTRCAPGIAAIAGTGSHVFGVNANGDAWRVGGWGHILGDEGSAYWLGLHALKAALRFRDGSGPPTEIVDRATRFYALERIEDIQALLYGKPLTKAEIAALAIEVSAAADAGDTVALALFDEAAADLAEQVRAAADALGLLDEEFSMAMIGSVFANEELMRERFEREVTAFAPAATFTVPDVPPVAGSVLLALRAEGWAEVGLDVVAESLRSSPATR